MGKNSDGDTIYVDLERIRKIREHVFYRTLVDRLKPKYGDYSLMIQHSGNCESFWTKKTSYSFHRQPMGNGASLDQEVKNPKRIYPTPNSVDETILKLVCY